jgi:ribosomal protein L10
MRQEINQLLKDYDFRVLSDYSNTNKEAWVSYRQELRTLP